jgi:cyclopropane fatty-acyl-phospholipid synthase-like methyltransferase
VGHEKRVLELGPGNGSVTRHLQREHGCRITAVELDDECAQLVQPYCQRIYRHDLNDAAWSKDIQLDIAANGAFDVILAADVLEHLYAPQKVLGAMRNLLAPGGRIVISLPIGCHSCVVASLLSGEFTYRENGLLDSTHIRFFGLRDVQKLVGLAGLAVSKASFVVKHPLETEFADLWLNLTFTQRRAAAQSRFGLVYQVVFEAVAASECQLPIVFEELTPPSVPLISRLKWWAKAVARKRLSPEMRAKLRGLAS